jgi:hypothetical protein
MHFHFQLANHYFAGIYRIEDIVAPIIWGLRALGHRVTTGILPNLPVWPSIVVLVEYFDREGYDSEVIALKQPGGPRHCLGVICTEDIDDDLVMNDPLYPRRRRNLLRILPHCDFVWNIVPSSYDKYVSPDRLAFVDFGYVEALRQDGRPAAQRDIDVLFYATINERRRQLMERLERRGLRVAATRGFLPNYIRTNFLSRAKVVLDTRRGEDVRFTSPSRICTALQIGSTVVSEKFDTSRLGFLYDYTQASSYEELEERCVQLAADPACVEVGLDARERFKRGTPMVENMRRALKLPVFDAVAAADGQR